MKPSTPSRILQGIYLLWGLGQLLLLPVLFLYSYDTGREADFLSGLWKYHFMSTGLLSLVLLVLPFLKNHRLLRTNNTLLYFGLFFTLVVHILASLYFLAVFKTGKAQAFPVPFFALAAVQLITIAFILVGSIQMGRLQPRLQINRIFISYSRRDSETALLVKSLLEENGFDVEIDVEAFAFGDHIQDRILQAIRDTDLTIGLISKNSLRSVWVGLELVNTLLKERLSNQQQFIGIQLDDSVFSKEFYQTLRQSLNQDLQTIKTDMKQALESGDGINHYQDDHNRIRDYLHYQNSLFRRLQQFILMDASDPVKRKDNLDALVKQLKNRLDIVKS